MIRILTAGESHGPALVGILEGMPAGVKISQRAIDRDLARRQMGYGRGGRMQIERDRAEILSGIRFGESIGSPIALLIHNRDFAHWKERMAQFGPPVGPAVTKPRPGHADLAGALKYQRADARDILERASARETAMRVGLGALAKALLGSCRIQVISHVVSLGGVRARSAHLGPADLARIDRSPVRCADPEAEVAMIEAIDRAKSAGDTLGGVIEVVAFGVPVGLGSHAHYDRRLDAQLASAMVSIPAIKGGEVGDAWWSAEQRGSAVHDPIAFTPGQGFTRPTNRAGGIEGGMSNGQPIRLRAAMKPLSSLRRPLMSADLITHQPFDAQVERSDVVALPAAGVVAEAVMALVLATALTEKFGAKTLTELKRAKAAYERRLHS